MRFFRYIATQLAAYGIDMGLFMVLVYLVSFPPVTSNVLSKIAAGIFAFIVHRSFTFQLEVKQHNRNQKYRYILLLGFNVPLSSGVLWLMLQVFDQPVFAKLLSDSAILMFNFWLSKTWVFVADKKNDHGDHHSFENQ